MKPFIGLTAIGLFGGGATVALWTLLWTVVTPMPLLTHQVFLNPLFAIGALFSVWFALPVMSRYAGIRRAGQ